MNAGDVSPWYTGFEEENVECGSVRWLQNSERQTHSVQKSSSLLLPVIHVKLMRSSESSKVLFNLKKYRNIKISITRNDLNRVSTIRQ